jgi:uncharacterized protein (DUF2141 family)
MKLTSQSLVIGLLMVCKTTLTFAQSDPLVLTVIVSGGEASKGQVILSVFSSPQNFLKEPIAETTELIDMQGSSVFQLIGITTGEYAISVVYDKDMNGKLNTGFLGIPTEFVGFSNNVKGVFGPPAYNDASFRLLKSEEMTIYLGKAKE